MTQGPPDPRSDFVSGQAQRGGQARATRAEIWRRLQLPLLGLVLVGLGATSVYLYTGQGRQTRQTEPTRGEGAVSEGQAEKLRLRSLELEAAFNQARLAHFDLREEDLLLLEQALQVQEQYIEARQSVGAENQRHRELRRRLHLLRSERLRAESTQAEAQALILVKTDAEGALLLLRRALACEEEIAAKWDAAGLADVGRRARLDTRLRRLESAPLWNRSRAEEAAAEKLLAANQFAAAARGFAEAQASEAEFLRKYRDVRDTEFGRLEQLGARRETALSGQLWGVVQAQRDLAERREKAGEWSAATPAWQAARDALHQLLTEYPRSTYANRTLEVSLVTRLNFTRFHGEIQATTTALQRLRETLRRRDTAAAFTQLGSVLKQAKDLADRETGAFLPDQPERQELEYLAAHESVARHLLARLDQDFLLLPGLNAKMHRTEITQGLYAAIMDSNPSASRGEFAPVESVSYPEAEAFCLRLGWVLGQKVRLPTLAEYQAALGAANPAPSAEVAWTAANTDGGSARPVATRQVNAAGFYDLLGNVEEWAASPAAASKASAVGGSVATSAVAGLGARELIKREKLRTLGFRVVME